jgi:lactococcin 972 family bacteriocin
MKASKLIATGSVVAALVLLPTVAALATTENVGGGLWQYGTTTADVYSNYHHPSLYHSSTACNAGVLGDKCDQGVAAAGAWAYASIGKSWLGGNTAYWNTY